MALTQVKSDGIATGAVTAEQIAVNAVTVDDISDGSINTAKLAADCVDGTKIADDAIDSEHYVDGSIDTAHIADDAVTADKLADTAVTAGSYGSASAIPAITVDAQGRITAASTNAISVESDRIFEGNTSAEVVDTGSDGHFKVVTEGTERWRVTSDGTLKSNSSDIALQYNIFQDRSGTDIIRTDSYTVYISDSGNDSTGDGSSSSPWRTLQKAFDNVPRLLTRTGYIIRILGSSFTNTGSSDIYGVGGGSWNYYYSGEGITIQADSGNVTYNLNNSGIAFHSIRVPIRLKNIDFLSTNGTTGYNGMAVSNCSDFIMYDSCTWSTGCQGSWSYYGGVRFTNCKSIQWNAAVTLLSNATSGLGGLFIYNACNYVNHTCNMIKNGTRWGNAAIVAQNGTLLIHGGNLDNFHTGIRLGTNHYSQASGSRCVLGNTSLYNLNIGIDAQYGSNLRSYYVPNIQNIGSSYNISSTSTQN